MASLPGDNNTAPEELADDVDRFIINKQESVRSLTNIRHDAFVPRETNANLEPTDGSLIAANFRRETTIGGLLNSRSSREFDPDKLDGFNFIQHVPGDLLQFADRFATDMNLEQIEETADLLRAELGDRALMAAHPWKSFVAGIPGQLIDPANLLPGGAIYKSTKLAGRILSAAAGTAISAGASAVIQEQILLSTQLTRETSESNWNIVAASIFGGVLGGASGAYAGRVKSQMVKEITNELTDTPKKLTDNGTLTGNEIANMPKSMQKAMNFSPMNRLLNSELPTAKQAGNILYEHNFNTAKNLSGDTLGASVETLIKTRKRKVSSVLMDVEDAFYQANGIGKGPFRGSRQYFQREAISRTGFYDAVSLVLTTDKPDINPHVNTAADIMRAKIFDPLKNDAIALGLLPEGIEVKNASNYFMIAWNKHLIVEQGGRNGPLREALFNDFKATQERIKNFKESVEYKSATGKIDKANLEIKKLKAKTSKLTPAKQKPHLESIKRLKKENKLTKAEIHKLAAPDMLTSKGELRSFKSDEVLLTDAMQTIDNLLAHQDGLSLNPILARLTGDGRSPLKERSLLVSQEAFRDWQITDAASIAEMYSRAMTPTVELTRAAQTHGHKTVADWQAAMSKQLLLEFQEQSKNLTGKAAAKAEKNYKSNVSDIVDTFKLLKGIYGDGPNILNNSGAQFYRNFLTWNSIRLLGFMTITSLADLGIHVFRHGPYQMIHNGLLAPLRDLKALRHNKTDLRAMGYGVETELGTKIKAFSEHQGLSTQVGPFQKGFDALAQKFGNATLMNQWNSWNQNMAGHISINRTLDTIHKIINGEKVTLKDKTRLAQLGIHERHFPVIAEKTKGFVDKRTGTRYSDMDNWKIESNADADALLQFQASIAKEIDSIVIIPGLGDKPLFAQEKLGKALLQFKTFLLAATNKILFSGIQRKGDLDVYTGLTSMLALGAMSYVITMMVRGDEPDLSFANLSQEAIDRSGVLGIFMEVYNIGKKTGLVPGSGVSRYQSRGIIGALTGPAGGFMEDIVSVMNRASGAVEGEQLTTKDAQKLLRLIPYQNLFYIYQLNRQATRDAALGLGFKDVDK